MFIIIFSVATTENYVKFCLLLLNKLTSIHESQKQVRRFIFRNILSHETFVNDFAIVHLCFMCKVEETGYWRYKFYFLVEGNR
jgi:hypothetical protein